MQIVYLLGPLARAVRILTWQVIAYLYYYVFIPFSEGATELAWAAFYYGTTGFLAYLSELAYEVACLLHIDHFIYGSSGFYGGGFRPGFAHIGHNPFPAVSTWNRFHFRVSWSYRKSLIRTPKKPLRFVDSRKNNSLGSIW